MTVRWKVYEDRWFDGKPSEPAYFATLSQAVRAAAAITGEPQWYIRRRLPDMRSAGVRDLRHDVAAGLQSVFIERVTE